MKQELETLTGLRLVLPDLKHDVLSVKESPFLATLALCRNMLVIFDDDDTLDEMYENLLQQAVKEAEHPDGRTVFIQRGRRCPDWVLNKLETSTLMIYPHDAGHQFNRKTDFWATVAAFLDDPQRGAHVVYDADSSNFVLTELKPEMEKRTRLTLILPDMNHNPISEQEDQLDVEHNTLSVKGNEFLAKLASYEDSQADIHTAVCTDVDRVRRVVKLSKDECVSSPVAEYWAGHEFRFKKPVTITLPHFLPPDPDPSLIILLCGRRRLLSN
nr:hypothetical protein BaRGS_021531 [Batillaria attramentaria]